MEARQNYLKGAVTHLSLPFFDEETNYLNHVWIITRFVVCKNFKLVSPNPTFHCCSFSWSLRLGCWKLTYENFQTNLIWNLLFLHQKGRALFVRRLDQTKLGNAIWTNNSYFEVGWIFKLWVNFWNKVELVKYELTFEILVNFWIIIEIF